MCLKRISCSNYHENFFSPWQDTSGGKCLICGSTFAVSDCHRDAFPQQLPLTAPMQTILRFPSFPLWGKNAKAAMTIIKVSCYSIQGLQRSTSRWAAIFVLQVWARLRYLESRWLGYRGRSHYHLGPLWACLGSSWRPIQEGQEAQEDDWKRRAPAPAVWRRLGVPTRDWGAVGRTTTWQSGRPPSSKRNWGWHCLHLISSIYLQTLRYMKFLSISLVSSI